MWRQTVRSAKLDICFIILSSFASVEGTVLQIRRGNGDNLGIILHRSKMLVHATLFSEKRKGRLFEQGHLLGLIWYLQKVRL